MSPLNLPRQAVNAIRMTQYSHGSGCGCKIAPKILDQILQGGIPTGAMPGLLVGNSSKDDAAAFDLGDGRALISTTDFFMPIVDDPFDFGRIAATNAISDIYAMGGDPLMAIAILGWPLDKLGPEVASEVVNGGRQVCLEAGIPLAGGHSIDAPEPIFGLAVSGIARHEHLKRNDQARPDSELFLTKPLGIGILTTAEKQGKLMAEHASLATEIMCRLNKVGADFGRMPSVSAMTDVTGFGLLGHLLEICEGSGLGATLDWEAIPKLPSIDAYIDAGCSPGGARRNFESYGDKVAPLAASRQALLCDPQTSGGLLVAVDRADTAAFIAAAAELGLALEAIGRLHPLHGQYRIQVQ